ncbi:hypothetical protein ACEN88_28505 [Massilia sp. CT11-108]|uniref:hypothetical protein n=1 Tax=Massilia sp. CT11-108 TaxID=3393900 RepID=UPI0039A74DCD
MPSKSPIFPGPRTARGMVLAILLSNADQAGAEPLRGRPARWTGSSSSRSASGTCA